MTMLETQFQVKKQALPQTRLVQRPAPALAEGELRVRLDTCAYTANNITYAAFGDAMQYWAFFAPYDASDDDWGCIPVWGFGDIVESRCAGLDVGERLYGFWPTASHARLVPARITPAGFVDGAAHRAALHAVYNQYSRCPADPLYTADTEDLQCLLRPLFTTSWLIDDFLADQGLLDAGSARVLLSSASSKTAIAAAAMLHRRQGIELVGLTSPRHRAFCESLGHYHRVLAYDELEGLDPAGPAVYVDFAGNAALRRRVHGHLPQLTYSCSVGGTHVDQLGPAGTLPGPRPTLFFAPAQAKKRMADWGGPVFQQRLVEAWQAFLHQACGGPAPWLRVLRHAAPAGLAELHGLVLQGQGDARDGHVMAWT
jgi:hypothetical protein